MREVIQQGRNGVLVDFFDVAGIAEAVVGAMDSGEVYRGWRDEAKAGTVGRFGTNRGLKGFESLLAYVKKSADAV